jgi:hypothetical protein
MEGAKIINHGIYSAQEIEAHTYPQILEARNPLLHSERDNGIKYY